MRRSWPNRISALLWAALFLLNWAGDGFGLHPCPHHGTAAADAHAQVAAGSHHPGHGAPEPGAPEGHSGQCTCVSACQLGAGTALPSAEPGLPLRAVLPPSAAPVAAASVRLPVRHPPHFLPYALAPPARG